MQAQLLSMIIEQYRYMADKAYLAFRETLHDIIYKASADIEVNEIDMELFKMHLIDLQENLDDIINGGTW